MPQRPPAPEPSEPDVYTDPLLRTIDDAGGPSVGDGFPVEAYFLRHSTTLWSALHLYISQGVDSMWRHRSLRKDRVREIQDRRRWRQKAVQSVVDGMREQGFLGAREALRNWVKEYGGEAIEAYRRSASQEVAWELNRYIEPLIVAYEDPKRFFREIGPRLYPDYFSPRYGAMWLREESVEGGFLGETLRLWGMGALLNPKVHKMFAEQRPEALRWVLYETLATRAFGQGKGRRRGSKDKSGARRAAPHEKRAALYEAVKTTVNEYEFLEGARLERINAVLDKNGLRGDVERWRGKISPAKAAAFAYNLLEKKFGWSRSAITDSRRVLKKAVKIS